MSRQGFTKVPNFIFEDNRLNAKHLALLVRLASHATGWIVKSDMEQAALGISEPTFLKLMRELESWRYLKRKKAYVDGKVAGLHVDIRWPKLTKKKDGLVSGEISTTEPLKPKPRTKGSLRRTITKKSASPAKGGSFGEVIDHQDEM